MGDTPRMTVPTQCVLRALLEKPDQEHYGYELTKESGLPSGTIYPILNRLEAAGWITSAWENIDESAEGRRRRRYYQLTPLGQRESARALEETRRRLFSRWTEEPA